MLPRRHRVAPRAELLAVLRRGFVMRGGGLTLRILATRRPVSRFAFVVSTKVAQNATVRNRLRRQASEAVRRLLPRVAAGYDVVVTVHPGRVPPAAELVTALTHGLRRGRLLYAAVATRRA